MTTASYIILAAARVFFRVRMLPSSIPAAVALAASVSSLARVVVDVAGIILCITATTTSIIINASFAFAPPHHQHQHHPHRCHLNPPRRFRQSSRGELRYHSRQKYRNNFLPNRITAIATTTSQSSHSSSSSSSSDEQGTDQPTKRQTKPILTTMWDANTQTYLNGIVPSHHDSSSDINTLLSLNGDGKLKIFGYGSLCWHAGSEGGVLSLADREEEEEEEEEEEYSERAATALATNNNNQHHTKEQRRKGRVITSPGMAIGYQRCWSQRSADHRGTPQFNGIVCTLLSDEEVETLQDEEITKQQHQQQQQQPLHPPPPFLQSTTSNSSNSRRKKVVSMTEGLIYTVDEDLVQECLAELDFREKGVSLSLF